MPWIRVLKREWPELLPGESVMYKDQTLTQQNKGDWKQRYLHLQRPKSRKDHLQHFILKSQLGRVVSTEDRVSLNNRENFFSCSFFLGPQHGLF